MEYIEMEHVVNFLVFLTAIGVLMLAFLVLIGVSILLLMGILILSGPGVIELFHELGHFLMARLFKVKVKVFSIGFGPVLLNKRIGETEYRLHALPYGGFVELYGGNLEDPRSYFSKPSWQRILITLGGPLFNFILAMLLFAFLFAFDRKMPKYALEKPIVGYVVEGSLAQKLGIREGDLLLEINSKRVKSWKDVGKMVFRSALNNNWEAKVLREGKVLNLSVRERLMPSMSFSGFGAKPDLPPIVGNVAKDSPTFQAGIREGDVVLRVNGVEVKNWYELVKEVKKSKDKPITLTLMRGFQVEEKTIVPKESKTPILDMASYIVLGIAPYIVLDMVPSYMERVKVEQPVQEAIFEGVERAYILSLLSLKAIWNFLTDWIWILLDDDLFIVIKTLGGPITIVQLTITQLVGEFGHNEILFFIGMTAFISIQVAILNLVPFRGSDGEYIFVLLIQSLRKSSSGNTIV